MDKKEITEEVGSICEYEMSGSFDHLIKVLEEHKKSYDFEGSSYFKVTLALKDVQYGAGDKEFSITATRLETDIEYNKRIEFEKVQKEIRRQRFLILKKEFGE